MNETKRIPRAEHPFPQMVRQAWMNLNGEWQFERDPSVSRNSIRSSSTTF